MWKLSLQHYLSDNNGGGEGAGMSGIDLGLSYWLPQTSFAVDITKRTVVETGQEGSFPRIVADVKISPMAVADPTSRHSLRIDAGFFEKISLTISLDDRGFIQSVNSEASRDISPALTFVGKLVPLLSALPVMGVLPVEPKPPASLEKQWDEAFEFLARIKARLEDRVKELLEKLCDDLPSDQIASCGAALDALQSHLATISQARRAWIAGHAGTLETRSWRLAPVDLLRIEEPALPEEIEDPAVPTAQADMAGSFGALVAIVDPEREQGRDNDTKESLVDQVALRRSRPATVGTYLRTDPLGRTWRLEPASVNSMDIVDGFSATDRLSIDGSWRRAEKFELSYHPDMSLKTFGFASTPSASAVATSIGEVIDGVTAARKAAAERDSAADRELEAATTQLNLLKVANESEILAATRARAAELAVLEQQKKLREAAAG
jgi:hypothetical protein